MKTALITGASGNLGKAVVNELQDTFEIAAVFQHGKAQNAAHISRTFEADLLNETDVKKLVESVTQIHGRLDAAVLTVGGYAAGSIYDTDKNALRKMMQLNFETAYFTAQACFKQMVTQKGGGRIVLIASRPALNPETGKDALAYTLAKSMLVDLAKILNLEGKAQNVVTSVIVPGVIDTPQNRQAMPDADTSLWVSPQTIAKTIHLACSSSVQDLQDPLFKMYGRG